MYGPRVRKDEQHLYTSLQLISLGEIYLNLHQVDGLHEPRLGRERRRVEDTPRRGDDLSTAPVDGVGVQGDVVDVEAHSAQVLVAEDSLELRRGWRPS